MHAPGQQRGLCSLMGPCWALGLSRGLIGYFRTFRGLIGHLRTFRGLLGYLRTFRGLIGFLRGLSKFWGLGLGPVGLLGMFASCRVPSRLGAFRSVVQGSWFEVSGLGFRV